MTMRVERRGDEFLVVISREALEAMRLEDGAEVEVRPVEAGKIRYLSVEEALASYRQTEPLHREAYRELAK